MNFVIPMAGKGSRFSDVGFKTPKMLIEAKGKTLLEWSLSSLPLHICTNLVFVVLKEHYVNYHIKEFIESKYPHLSMITTYVCLENVTRGQSETVLKAKDALDYSEGILIYNIDTWFTSSTLEQKLLSGKYDGIVGAFVSSDPRYSFAKLGEKGNVVEVAEKIAISNYALTGMYYFKSVEEYINAAEYAIINNEVVKKEFYIAPLYNKLIAHGRNITIDLVEDFSVLGTPEELGAFIEKK